MHGKQSRIRIHNENRIFKGLEAEEDVARYHSLVAAPESIPDCLEVIGEDTYGEIMAVAHREYPIFGLQFHPESILTPNGRQMMKNFLSL